MWPIIVGCIAWGRPAAREAGGSRAHRKAVSRASLTSVSLGATPAAARVSTCWTNSALAAYAGMPGGVPAGIVGSAVTIAELPAGPDYTSDAGERSVPYSTVTDLARLRGLSTS